MEPRFETIRSDRGKAKGDWTITLLCCACLALIGCLLYFPGLRLGLSVDDRYLISLLRGLRWDEFVLMNDGFRFRPVSQLAIQIAWQVCGCDAARFIQIIPCLNILMGVILFLAADHLFKNRLLSFAIGAAYLTARFAYYQVLQLLGIMEGSALFCAMAVLLFAIDFVFNERNRGIWLALLFYLLAIYCHERYMTLGAVPMAAIWLRAFKRGNRGLSLFRRVLYSAVTVAICAGALAARFILFRGNAWTGTGGTDMQSTFSARSVLTFMLKHILYLMGRGADEAYLSGYPTAEMSGAVTAATLIYELCFAGLIAACAVVYLKDGREKRGDILRGMLLVAVFIGACILAASTTIRVEMRWVYVSYTALLIGAGMMASYALHGPVKVMRVVAGALAAAFFLSTCYVEYAYRKGWENQFYYSGLAEDDALLEVVRRYPDIQSRELVIIDNDNHISVQGVEEFLSLMDPDGAYMPADIVRLNTVKQYQESDRYGGVVVVYRDGAFRDLTGVLDVTEAIDVVSGAWYDDDWCSNDLTIEITPYRVGGYRLTFYTNADISGLTDEERTFTIAVNDGPGETFVFDGSDEWELSLNLNEVNTVRIQTPLVNPDVFRDGMDMSYVLQMFPLQ